MRKSAVPAVLLSVWLTTGCVAANDADVSPTASATGTPTASETGSSVPTSSPPAASSPSTPSPTSPSPSVGQGGAAPAPTAAPVGSIPPISGASAECWDLLTDETKQHQTEEVANGLGYEPDFETTAGSADPETFGRMIEYGGTLCMSGFENTDNVWTYGYSPMDDAGMAELRALLTSRAYQSKTSADGDVLCLPSDFSDECFLFGTSEIFFSSYESELPDLVVGAHDS